MLLERGVHHLLDLRFRALLERFAAEIAQDNAVFRRHHTQVAVQLQIGEPLTWTAGRRVAVGDRADARLARVVAFARQATCEPVSFAGEVAIYPGVAESFEPPRGSVAQVSIDALTVHHHGAALVVAQVERPS